MGGRSGGGGAVPETMSVIIVLGLIPSSFLIENLLTCVILDL